MSTSNLQLEGVLAPNGSAAPANETRRLTWLKKGCLALLDQGLLSGANFLIAILLARWLARDAYGAYALGFSIFILLYGLHNAFFLEPMSVFGPEAHSRCLSGYVKKLCGFHFLFAALLSLLVIAAIVVLSVTHVDQSLTSALWGVGISMPFILFYWLCRRAAYLKFAPGLAVVGSLTYFVAVLALVLVLKNWLSPFTAFLIQGLAALPAVSLLLFSLRRNVHGEGSPSNAEVVREHWRYGRWVMGSALVNWLSGYGYYVLVGALLPMQDVAALRALRNLTEPCYRAMAAIILLVLPWASARFAEEGVKGLRRRLRQLNWLFGGSAIVYFIIVCIFRNFIMNVLYAGKYNESSHLLILATAPLVLIAASLGSEVAVQVMQAPSEVFLAYGASGALTLVLGVALTHFWGLLGGLVSMLISAAAVLVVLTYRCQVRLRETGGETINSLPIHEPENERI